MTARAGNDVNRNRRFRGHDGRRRRGCLANTPRRTLSGTRRFGRRHASRQIRRASGNHNIIRGSCCRRLPIRHAERETEHDPSHGKTEHYSDDPGVFREEDESETSGSAE